jgi:hypothetical protein
LRRVLPGNSSSPTSGRLDSPATLANIGASPRPEFCDGGADMANTWPWVEQRTVMAWFTTGPAKLAGLAEQVIWFVVRFGVPVKDKISGVVPA